MEIPRGVTARPRPSPVKLTLDQRRALPICEFYSARMGRAVMIPSAAYWFGLWLEWSPRVSNYVELPANPGTPDSWLANFWVECGGDEFLIDVEFGEQLPSTKLAVDPWTLQSDGFESATSDTNAKITARWLWARRTILLHLEQAHPFAVAAQLQGGLKAQCNRVLSDISELGENLIGLCGRSDASAYTTQCAAFHLVRTGKLAIDWRSELSSNTRFQKVGDAPQG